MAPIVATLIKWGMGTLAGAVASKGKDLIQEKLGINLEDALGTEAGRLQLKQLEMQHEQFLMDKVEAADIRDLEFFKAEVTDKDSARNREVEMEKLRDAPWWVPSTLTLLTFTVVVGGGYMFWMTENTEVRYALIAIVTGVLQYYYGTTRSSQANGAAIRAIASRGQS
jgi:hypothetical protein